MLVVVSSRPHAVLSVIQQTNPRMVVICSRPQASRALPPSSQVGSGAGPFVAQQLLLYAHAMRLPALRTRCVILLLGAAAPYAGGVAAAAETAATHCRFEGFGEQVPATGRLKRILDGRSVLLEDGRELRLAGIEVPLFSASLKDTAGQAAAAAAATALQRLLEGAPLAFKRLGPDLDRYGRLLAQ